MSEQPERCPKMCPECHSLDKGKPLHHNGQVACHHPWHSTGSQPVAPPSTGMSARAFDQLHPEYWPSGTDDDKDHEKRMQFAEAYAADLRSRLRVLQRFVHNKGQLNPCNCGLLEALSSPKEKRS